MNAYFHHAKACYRQAFDGGVFYVLSGYLLRFARMGVLVLLWRQILQTHGEGMTPQQALCYTFWSAVLAQQLAVHTPASEDFWMGTLGMRYLRPLPVLMQFVAETVGRWIPGLLLFSLPMVLLSPLLQIPIGPLDLIHGWAGLLSLLLTLSLGFALDFLFTAFAVRLKNTSYQAKLLRDALTLFCAGTVIPFAAMPWGLGNILALLPLGSLAGAPLSIYTGLAPIATTLLMQLVWNLVLWPLSLVCYRKSEEKLVIYGG